MIDGVKCIGLGCTKFTGLVELFDTRRCVPNPVARVVDLDRNPIERFCFRECLSIKALPFGMAERLNGFLELHGDSLAQSNIGSVPLVTGLVTPVRGNAHDQPLQPR